jgi:DNA-binding response OmpR family regulator
MAGNRDDTRLSMKSILIADSSDAVLDLLAEAFALDGWAVTRTSSSAWAAEVLRGPDHYDALLLGYRFIVDMDGVALITGVRALDHRKDLPIVLATANTECEVVAAALAAGADDVVHKPADIDALVMVVKKCIERRRPGR